ncbi:MAG: hypothetical protein G01um101466_82 [Parcubacteria group bacterium Gr01-1014_66]|nr:MAG: hypothetical protein G01um101466_82 [Parcubacteria group bacterium Gr01-1014_66]
MSNADDFQTNPLPNNDVLSYFDMADAPEEEQIAFLCKIIELILMRVASRVKEGLPPGQQQKFMELFARDASGEERARFLKDYVPTFEDIYMEEIMRFRVAVLKEQQRAVIPR